MSIQDKQEIQNIWGVKLNKNNVEVFELYPAIKALDALNTLIWYSVSKWMDFMNWGTIMKSDDVINRLKPYIEVLRQELLDIERNLSDEYTTLKFSPDWNNHWKCEKCLSMQSFWTHCKQCWRKSITWANWENNYSLIK